MNASFLENFTNENNFAIETFDFVIEIDTSSKNSLIQHIEHSKTLKKNSIYIELFALSAFDFNIDIDFEIYIIYSIISAITYSSTHSHASFSSFSSFSSFISSITLQVDETISYHEKKQSSTCFVERIDEYDKEIIAKIYHAISNYEKKQSSTCFVDYATSNYEKKQFSTCFVECHTNSKLQVIENTFCYEEKQNICFVNTISNITTSKNIVITKFIVAKFIVTKFVHHTLLIYCLI